MKTFTYFFIFSVYMFVTHLSVVLNAQNISTVAGTGTLGFNTDGIAATSAQLNAPYNVAFDASGNIYIADTYNHRIRQVTVSTGLISTVAGTGVAGFNGDGIAATSAQLNNPQDVTLDASGNIYIADYINHRIRKVTVSTGLISTVAGTGTAGFNGDGIAATSAQLNAPFSVALDNASGNIYIADYLNQRIRKVTVSTGIISTVAGTGTAGFNGDGIAATSALLNNPIGIALDNATGNIYIGEFVNRRIRQVTVSTGLISTVAGTGVAGFNGDGIAATSAQLNAPHGVALDASGNIYIADRSNHRLRKVTVSTGLISTVAGTGAAGFNGDGIAATSAQLNLPLGVDLDASGNIYIADALNHRIRKISGVILPIELLSFTAECKNNTVELNWSTANESNNDYFTIERTLNGFNYEVIGTVTGAGNSNATQYYSLTDNEPLPGITYYRLKQTDFDGQYKYFPLEPAICGNGIDIISIYPNPAIGETSIIVSSSELTGVTINLIDVLSRKVLSNAAYAKQGDNIFTMDVSELSSGSYMLQVVTESGLYRAQKQFVIK